MMEALSSKPAPPRELSLCHEFARMTGTIIFMSAFYGICRLRVKPKRSPHLVPGTPVIVRAV